MPSHVRIVIRPLLAATLLSFGAADASAQAESLRTGIEYATPMAAFRALHADRGVQFETRNGWTVATDRARHTVWTFAPVDDPAYPSVVKRTLVDRDGPLSMQTSVQCGGTKAVCDDFVRKFIALNEQMARAAAAHASARAQ